MATVPESRTNIQTSSYCVLLEFQFIHSANFGKVVLRVRRLALGGELGGPKRAAWAGCPRILLLAETHI